MGIAALFRSGNVPIYRVVLFCDGLLHGVIKLDIIRGYDRDLAVLHVGHVADVLYYRGDVACDEIAALTVAYKQRCILARGNEMLRLVNTHDTQRIRALDAAQDLENRLEEISGLGIVKCNELSHDLSVGLGFKRIALRNKIIAQLNVVFDYAVMNDGYLAAQMRVGVYIIRLAVSGPSGMTDAHLAFDALAALNNVAENLEAALCLFYPELPVSGDDRYSGRVIAAVLKSFKPVKQYGSRLIASNKANYSAHN